MIYACLLAYFTSMCGVASAASFQGLGVLSGTNHDQSEALGISGDGSVVVGRSYDGFGEKAVYWVNGANAVEVPSPFGGRAVDASYDGYIIVGYDARIGDDAGFRYNVATDTFQFIDFSGSVRIYAVSDDGSTVVGSPASGSAAAYYWKDTFPGSAAAALLDLAGGTDAPLVRGISGDGSTAVGWGVGSDLLAVRWTDFGQLPTAITSLEDTRAYDASVDGSVIVGKDFDTAFRWAEVGGFEDLGALPSSFVSSIAHAVSADGSIVVGSSSSDTSGAFIWDPSNGMRELQAVLVNELGLGLTGWTLLSAEAVSADGRTVAGYGTNPSGKREAWVATLGPRLIPEIGLFPGITFDTEDGVNYSIQASDSMLGPFTAIGSVAGDGNPQTFIDDRGLGTEQFYKVAED